MTERRSVARKLGRGGAAAGPARGCAAADAIDAVVAADAQSGNRLLQAADDALVRVALRLRARASRAGP